MFQAVIFSRVYDCPSPFCCTKTF